jgi:5-amino-6-(5-phosphoribosylamino)uracil reductase
LGVSLAEALPHVTVILATSADGKIADRDRTAARFSSPQDLAHLEAQVAAVDGVLFGATTLRAYGTCLRVRSPDLLRQRQQRGQPPQPVQIVCSRQGQLDPQMRFFRQEVPRWLLTTAPGAKRWAGSPAFERILTLPLKDAQSGEGSETDWAIALATLRQLGLQRLAVLGGGELVAALLQADVIDDLWLTLCPLLLGGRDAPTLVAGEGFPTAAAPRLELLSVDRVGDEVFLHYRRCHSQGD